MSGSRARDRRGTGAERPRNDPSPSVRARRSAGSHHDPSRRPRSDARSDVGVGGESWPGSCYRRQEAAEWSTPDGPSLTPVTRVRIPYGLSRKALASAAVFPSLDPIPGRCRRRRKAADRGGLAQDWPAPNQPAQTPPTPSGTPKKASAGSDTTTPWKRRRRRPPSSPRAGVRLDRAPYTQDVVGSSPAPPMPRTSMNCLEITVRARPRSGRASRG